MLLIVGLGNPGKKYEHHRHNIGFRALDAICHANGFGPFRVRDSGLVAEAVRDGEKILALKPMKYMNLSGQAVSQLARFYKIPLDNIIVIHDDIELNPGQLRLKKGGGAGGHNGLKDIDARIGKDYWRVRIGVGHPGHRDQVADYVLHNFSKADEKWIEPLLDLIAQEFPLLLSQEKNQYLNRIALVRNPKKPPKKQRDCEE